MKLSKRIKLLKTGSNLLKIFIIFLIVSIPICIYLGITLLPGKLVLFIVYLSVSFLIGLILFWSGIISVYASSVQLGIKWRVIGLLFGWIPILHIWALFKIMSIVSLEIETEIQKEELNFVRAENEECKTKYPLLLVHGVFFRDVKFYSYWGRIPKELMRNGAKIIYGNQQSAASVKDCGEELAERIRQTVKDMECEKVNIIAHSKGGLDARYAVACCGVTEYVASLSIVNTPNHGCKYADYLLMKVPSVIRNKIAEKYNNTLKKFGEQDPDFISAVTDLTTYRCEELNKEMKDAPGVYYQSYMTVMPKARSGKFPLNISYLFVKKFDGANDGLVSVESAKWGDNYTLITSNPKRGISHGDIIDLNRENIPGFDVREFYISLAHNLKELGF